jgi:hypothetical protein
MISSSECLNHKKVIYYLPGAGGQLSTGLGQGLMQLGFDVFGRETRGEFRRLSFDEQLRVIRTDIQDDFWHEDAQLVCNSFGAYLYLHAQTELQPFIGRVLMLSPIVGDFASEETGTTFSPPRPTRLRELAEAGAFNAPKNCVIYVGEHDWQSIPKNVQHFGLLTGIQVNVVPDRGHDLGKDCVGPILENWLKR